MKQYLIVFSLLTFVLYGCKKDEGLNDSDHKDKFIKAMGVNTQGVDLKQTEDGGFILVGTTQGGSSQDIYVKKVDAFGNSEWSKSFDGPAGGKDEMVAGIDILADGGYVIGGTTILDVPVNPLDSTSTITVELSSTFLLILDELGNKRLPFLTYNSGKIDPLIEKEDEQCFKIQVVSSGNILFVSEKRVVEGSTGEVKASYARVVDGSNFSFLGESLADLSDTSQIGSDVGFRDIVFTSAGEIVATGYTNVVGLNASGNSLLLSVLDASNEFTKNLSYGNNNENRGLRIKETSSGDILCAGYTFENGNQNVYLINFPDVVSELTPPSSWEFVGEKAGNQQVIDFFEVSDGYVLAGYSEFNNNRQFYIAKLSLDGSSLLWEREYGFTGFDEAKAVVSTVDGGIALLGTSSDERGNLVMTLLKLDSSGNLR